MLADGSDVDSAVGSLEVLPRPSSDLRIASRPTRGRPTARCCSWVGPRIKLVYVTAGETVLVRSGGRQGESLVTRFRLVGGNGRAYPVGQKKLAGISNYFIGNDPAKWRTNIETYQEVVSAQTCMTASIWSITACAAGWSTTSASLRASILPKSSWNFPMPPGCPSTRTALVRRTQDNGAESRHSAPVMYQTLNGAFEAVKGAWILKGRGPTGYAIAAYDRGRELVIDPSSSARTWAAH